MVYDAESCSIVIDAAELCELAHKGGDLGVRHRCPSESKNISSEIYKSIYTNTLAYCSHDEKVSITREYKGLYYTVNAIADTVFKKESGIRVDIIRSVRKFDFYTSPRQSLLSYLKICALSCAKRYCLNGIALRLYFVLKDSDKDENGKIRSFDYYYSAEELEYHFFRLIDKISTRAVALYERERYELESAASCVFPYESLREGQEIMIRECYSHIKNGKRLFLQAPTGTGKTVGSLYPAIRAVGNKLVDKVFYLTSKASTRREAFRGASRLFEAGAKLRTVVVSAKEQVCLCPAHALGISGSHCNPIECSYAAGYYDRVEGALNELLESGHGYTVKRISQIARKHNVCPYELSLDLSELCDIIICDYNYVFDPSVYFRRYFSQEALDTSKYLFLIDEAHNLADRARDMYSASLTNLLFERIYSNIDQSEKELNEFFERIILVIRAQKKLCKDTLTKDRFGREHGFFISNTHLELVTKELDIFKKQAEEWLKSNREHILWNSVNEAASYVKKYLCVAEYFDSRFYNYVYVDTDVIGVNIFCLDPSYILDKIQNRAHSSIMFSATLTPLDYFSQILGGGKDAGRIDLPSPFDPKKLCVAVASYVSARFDDRESNIAKYVSVIAATVSRRAGNYIAYFPSYDCLEKVYSAFTKKYPKVDTVVQKRGMTLKEKEEFLDFFKDDSGVLRVGFCVLGGSFSEGVDLPGGRLIGVVIFGVGLPGLSNERNIMKDYYDNRSEIGYDYAYTYPGMNNVLQAAGRVIRRDDDKGVVVLADDRYCEGKYLMLLPEHWKLLKKANNASELAQIIQNFWSKE